MREVFEARNLGRIVTELAGGVPPLTVEGILGWHGALLAGIRDDAAGRFRSGREWVRVGNHVGASPDSVPRLIEDLLAWYQQDGSMWFLDKIARFHLEFEAIHPFVDGNGRMGRVLINQQLMSLGWPPVIVRDKGKTTDYYPLFTGYVVTERFDGLSRLLALLLQESLHKRLTLFAGRQIIPLPQWARRAGVPGNSAANKAKRQTIPAFRLRQTWMIDSAFTGDSGPWLDALQIPLETSAPGS
jgi:Fic family protein